MYTRRTTDRPAAPRVVEARLARLAGAGLATTPLLESYQTQAPPALDGAGGGDDGGRTALITPWRIAGWLWAGRLFLVTAIILGAVGGLLLSRTISPRFTSYVDLIVAPADNRLLPDGSTANASQAAQLLEIDSRLRILTSTNVLTRVVEALGLENDPEFVGSSGWTLPWFGQGDEISTADAILTATRNLYEKVSAWRDTQSYVITLEVNSQDPQKSVEIAQAMTSAFQEELWAADRQASTMAAQALRERLAVLGEKVSAAEQAVEAFRREKGLQANDGLLLSSQSLSQFNAQLNDARTALIDAQSRHGELVVGRSAALAGESGTDTEAMAALRAEYYALQQEMDSLTAVYGPRHPSIVALRPQIVAVRAAMDQEYDRIVAAAATDTERARSVVDQLTAQLQAARENVSDEEASQVELRALEREAETQAAVYETYLQRLSEITQRSQMEITAVRVISPALPAVGRSWPPRAIILIAAGILAASAIGVGLAIARGAWSDFWPGIRQKMVNNPAPL